MRPAWPAGVVVRRREPLAPHTARRTGGACDAFVVVHVPEVLAEALAAVREEGWSVSLLGAGTRTVVRDGGLAGAVVRLGTGFCRMEADDLHWTAGAAVPVGALVGATVAAGHGGLEDLAGTPGSLGAALLLDDGWSGVVEAVRYLRRGRSREGTLEEARAATAILGARFRLHLADRDALRVRVRQVLARSRAWSWYAPLGADVRRVLRRGGVGGVRLRQVALPEAAPEAMVNLGGGTAADLSLLERSVVDRVARERGVDLKTAVRWAGRHRGGE